jgi:hypothetical protein
LLSRTISSLVAVPHSRRRASRLADRFSEVPCPDPNIDIAIRIRNRYSRTPARGGQYHPSCQPYLRAQK